MDMDSPFSATPTPMNVDMTKAIEDRGNNQRRHILYAKKPKRP
jgi:hypothetical protein